MLYVHVNMLIHSGKQNSHGSIIPHVPFQIPCDMNLNIKFEVL